MYNILFILPNLQGGGAERVVLNVIRALDQTKFKPILFLIKNTGDYWNEVPENVEIVVALESNQQSRLNALKILFKLLKVSRRVDIIVGALELSATYYAVVAGLILRKPTVGWVHTDLNRYLAIQKPFHSKLVRWLYPHLMVIIAVSSGAAKTVEQLLPKMRDKVKTVYNPLPEKIFELAEEPLQINKSLPMVLGVGRLDFHKGFDVLIRAHAKLVAKGIQHKLMILGEGKDRENLESLVKELGVENSVIMRGFQPNPYKWMNSADVFVLSSRFEGFGMVLIEAMALGVPVVSTACPSGPVEILDNGRFGLLVPDGDVDALVGAIAQVLTDSNVANHLRMIGPQRAKDFSPETIIPQYEKILSEVLQ